MSLDAIRWAWEQKVRSSAQRLVLLAMADLCRRRSAVSFPSRERLHAMTLLDLKTITAATRDLASIGLIRDTGERRGKSGRIAVYELDIAGDNGTKNGPIEKGEKRNDCPAPPVTECHEKSATDRMEPNFQQDASVFGVETLPFFPSAMLPKTEDRTGYTTEPGYEPGKAEPCRAAGAPIASLSGAAAEKPVEEKKQSTPAKLLDKPLTRSAHPAKPAFRKDATAKETWQSAIDRGRAVGLDPRPGERRVDFLIRVSKAMGNTGSHTTTAN